MRQYSPIHVDTNLNDDWWAAKGMKLGKDIFYNAIRDASGRYDGYIVSTGEYPNRQPHVMRTIAEAEEVIRKIDGKTI